MKTFVATVVALALTVSVQAAAPDVTGTWSLAVDGPHGAGTMALVLKQEGTRVLGTFASGHGPDIALEGELADSTLKLESAEDGHHKIIFNAKLKDDGTLAGYVSGPMGDIEWTASRAAEKKDKK